MAHDTFKRALSKIWDEIMLGPPGAEAYVLNPADEGLLGQLEHLSAQAASRRPMPGKTTIAAHIDHVCYGISLANRWGSGESNPWAGADWEKSWSRLEIGEIEWRELRDTLRRATVQWKKILDEREEWDDMSAAGAIALAAHAGYHLGAVRQIIAALELTDATAPK